MLWGVAANNGTHYWHAVEQVGPGSFDHVVGWGLDDNSFMVPALRETQTDTHTDTQKRTDTQTHIHRNAHRQRRTDRSLTRHPQTQNLLQWQQPQSWMTYMDE